MSISNEQFTVSPLMLESLKLADGQASLALLNVLAGTDRLVVRARAVSLLRHLEVPAQVHHLQLVLEDKSELPNIRRIAAAALRRINTPEAEEVLIRTIEIRDSEVLSAVVTALGRIGREKALKAITEAASYASGLASTRAPFAAALISHRLGLDGNDWPAPKQEEYLGRSSEAIHPVGITRAEEEEVSRCLQSLANEPFGIEFSTEHCYRLACQENNWMLLLNRDLTGPHAIRRLRQRKSFFGVVARKSPATNSYSVSFLILISPRRAHSNSVSIHRSTGEAVFAGVANMTGEAAKFEITSLAGPGAFAFRFEGAFDGQEFKFETVLSGLSAHKLFSPIRKSNNLNIRYA